MNTAALISMHTRAATPPIEPASRFFISKKTIAIRQLAAKPHRIAEADRSTAITKLTATEISAGRRLWRLKPPAAKKQNGRPRFLPP